MSKASARWGAVTMAGIAAVAAVLSYFDGLFVVRLAGNDDWRAFLYPLLPDGLIVICLIALLGAGKRPKWATCGLVLGIGLTLAMNVGAGVAHSPLDAVVDGFVPVVFFVAVEVFIGYIRRGRTAPETAKELTVPGEVPSDSLHAARMRLRFAAEHDFRVTPNDTQERFGLTRASARSLHAEFAPKEPPAVSAAGDGAHTPPIVGAAPAGVRPPSPAGAFDRGRDGKHVAPSSVAVPVTQSVNGSGHG